MSQNKKRAKQNTQNGQKAAKKQILISTRGESAKEKCFNIDLKSELKKFGP